MEDMGFGVIESIHREHNYKWGSDMLDIVVVTMSSWSEKGVEFRNKLNLGPNKKRAVQVIPSCETIYPWDFYQVESTSSASN
jgi:hypothetical protein